jgi:hypothetical protein
VLTLLVLDAARRGADWAGIAEGAVGADWAARGAVDTDVAAAARWFGMRCVVSVAAAFPAPTNAGSPTPLSNRRTAAGDNATCEVENSRNAPGSGFGDASSRASRSRIWSFTTR